jgi:hypothetical protein
MKARRVLKARLARAVVPARGRVKLATARPALETIEAFVEAAQASGPIVRLGGAAEDATTACCPFCRRHAAKPMSPRDAADARRAVRRAGLDDAVAFAFSKTTILVTESNRLRICPCDLQAWRSAVELYQHDPRAAWRSIGLDRRRLKGAA